MIALPLVDKDYILQKYPGKGGWTFAIIPEILPNKKAPFGWVQVKGTIDGFPIKQYKLMPMGNGNLFLPVRAEIRKKIKKETGDYVHVILFSDDSVLEIPEELLLCFEDEPKTVYETFSTFSESQQKIYVDWIYEAKKDETRATRILKMMDRLKRGLKLNDPE